MTEVANSALFRVTIPRQQRFVVPAAWENEDEKSPTPGQLQFR